MLHMQGAVWFVQRPMPLPVIDLVLFINGTITDSHGFNEVL